MDRIAEIKSHLRVAEDNEHKASEHFWEAARLIWEEVNDGTSRRELARALGKSHTHIRYLYNCWEMVGAKADNLPPFNAVYNSDEVRGRDEEEEEGQSQTASRGARNLKPDHDPDRSVHHLIGIAASNINEVRHRRDISKVITEDDITVLQGVLDDIRALLRDIAARNRRR
jgi:hypothetical protein